jgi:hypothetical protein
MTAERTHCQKPESCPAKPGRHCLYCHARNNALRNNASPAMQTPEVREKRTQRYVATRMAWLRPEDKELNQILSKSKHMLLAERKQMLGQKEVLENVRAAAKKRKRDQDQSY